MQRLGSRGWLLVFAPLEDTLWSCDVTTTTEDCSCLNEDRTTAAYDRVFCFLAGLAPTLIMRGCEIVSMLTDVCVCARAERWARPLGMLPPEVDGCGEKKVSEMGRGLPGFCQANFGLDCVIRTWFETVGGSYAVVPRGE